LILREEHMVRVFQNRMLRRLYGPRRAEVTGGLRGLHIAELHNLQTRMRWVWHVARMGPNMNTHRLLVEKSEGKIPLGIPIRRCVDNIVMDLMEIGRGGRGMGWIDQARTMTSEWLL
jgi:hypothetical protein